jgi:probable rRNA maturation factor
MPRARPQPRRTRRRSRPARRRDAEPPTPDTGALEVVLLNRQRRYAPRPERLRAVLRGAAAALGVAGEVALVLTGDAQLRELNVRYRGKDKPTDVLSFPGEGGELGLGDIVISVPTAARNARAYGRSLPQELDVLALHGFLHVLGFDHETDDGTMDRLEKRLRRELL